MLSRPESFGFLDALATRLTVPSSDSHQAMKSQDWRSQTTFAIIAKVDRARESFYSHARNFRIGFGIMMRMQTFLEKQGYKGLQWSADLHKEGGLCEAMVDVLRGKLGRDIKLLGMFTKSIPYFFTNFLTDFLHCTRKLKPNELHGILEEFITFFDISSQILSDDREAHTTIARFQSLLPSDTHNNVQVYSDVANRLSEWTKTFLKYIRLFFVLFSNCDLFNVCLSRTNLVPLEDADLWDIWYTGTSPFPSEVRQPFYVILYSQSFRTTFLAHKSIHSGVSIIWFTSTS